MTINSTVNSELTALNVTDGSKATVTLAPGQYRVELQSLSIAASTTSAASTNAAASSSTASQNNTPTQTTTVTAQVNINGQAYSLSAQTSTAALLSTGTPNLTTSLPAQGQLQIHKDGSATLVINQVATQSAAATLSTPPALQTAILQHALLALATATQLGNNGAANASGGLFAGNLLANSSRWQLQANPAVVLQLPFTGSQLQALTSPASTLQLQWQSSSSTLLWQLLASTQTSSSASNASSYSNANLSNRSAAPELVLAQVRTAPDKLISQVLSNDVRVDSQGQLHFTAKGALATANNGAQPLALTPSSQQQLISKLPSVLATIFAGTTANVTTSIDKPLLTGKFSADFRQLTLSTAATSNAVTSNAVSSNAVASNVKTTSANNANELASKSLPLQHLSITRQPSTDSNMQASARERSTVTTQAQPQLATKSTDANNPARSASVSGSPSPAVNGSPSGVRASAIQAPTAQHMSKAQQWQNDLQQLQQHLAQRWTATTGNAEVNKQQPGTVIPSRAPANEKPFSNNLGTTANAKELASTAATAASKNSGPNPNDVESVTKTLSAPARIADGGAKAESSALAQKLVALLTQASAPPQTAEHSRVNLDAQLNYLTPLAPPLPNTAQQPLAPAQQLAGLVLLALLGRLQNTSAKPQAERLLQALGEVLPDISAETTTTTLAGSSTSTSDKSPLAQLLSQFAKQLAEPEQQQPVMALHRQMRELQQQHADNSLTMPILHMPLPASTANQQASYIEIGHDGGQHEQAGKQKQWFLRMQFDLAPLGQLSSFVTLSPNLANITARTDRANHAEQSAAPSVQLQFQADNDALLQSLQQQTRHFRERLKAQGVNVTAISEQRREPHAAVRYSSLFYKKV